MVVSPNGIVQHVSTKSDSPTFSRRRPPAFNSLRLGRRSAPLCPRLRLFSVLRQRKQAMLWENERLNLMPTPRATFPVAEGIGIFVGIVAWDLLSNGHMDIAKAALVAVPSSLVWFGIRCWKTRN